MSEKSTRRVKKKWGKVFESTVIERAAVIDEELAENIEKDIKNSDAITPQELADKHGIRVSLAKKILRKFADDGVIQLQFKTNSYEIYKS